MLLQSRILFGGLLLVRIVWFVLGAGFWEDLRSTRNDRVRWRSVGEVE